MTERMPDPDAVASLTAAERECLQRVLGHQTAKEMALDLGISHHAVEKRLKRARTKLGASSSLEAARWTAGSGRAVSYPSDLEHAAEPADAASTSPALGRKLAAGVLIMFTIAIAGFLILADGQPSETEMTDAAAAQIINEMQADMDGAQKAFAAMDTDKSGYIERTEFVDPLRGGGVKRIWRVEGETGAPAVQTLPSDTAKSLRGETFDMIDRNDDGVLDKGEFVSQQVEGIGVRIIELPKTQ